MTTDHLSDRERIAFAYKHNVQDMADAILNLRRAVRRARAFAENTQIHAERMHRDLNDQRLRVSALEAEMSVGKAFHDVAVAERNAAWTECARAKAAHEKDFKTLDDVLDERARLLAENARYRRWATTGRF